MNDLPSKEQLLQDPIREKFVFLTSESQTQTCIGLTDKTDFHGVVYKYGKVTIPDETKLNSENKLNLKFEYDILENNTDEMIRRSQEQKLKELNNGSNAS